ncbi:hypothetical protein Goklo_029779 [Gossypium klotzschianum]|uniref:Aminotransferase-like plant mobile domain-containing protein n=2 Tax=Gossypium klotzschianum TaxID=34286 RepID=A0A7J8WFD8_9ROSI|nr:hypothetical protein [Gossypium klotzschianum]
MKVDKHLFWALAQFWNPVYSCFTFKKVNLVLTKNLKDIVLAHLDAKKRVDVFALSIYGLVVFSKALGHVERVKVDLSDVHSYYSHGSTVIFRNLEKWMAILQNLQKEGVEWRAPWLLPDEILYRCGDFDWVSLLGI